MFRYMALLVAKDFLTGGTWQDFNTKCLHNGYRLPDLNTIQYLRDHIGELVQLPNEQCNETYSTNTLMSDWRNVLLVTDVSHHIIRSWKPGSS